MSPDTEKIRQILLDRIHDETGWGKPLRPYCEFEDLYNQGILNYPDGSFQVSFRYIFDEDGFSQYDKNHVLDGKIIFSCNYDILSFGLEEVVTGIACIKEPYQLSK